jgi:ribosome-binding protein aMBF1 (putative translation factor)
MEILSTDEFVEAIKEGEIIRVPESVAIEEDLFILRRVLQPASGPVEVERKPDAVGKILRLDEWKKGKFNKGNNNVVKDLVDNFHWEIARMRRVKGISRKQLADKVGVDEEEIKMIELGELPRDDFVLINRIEEFLGISLRREKQAKGVTLSDLQKMNEDKVKEEIEKTHKNELSGGVKGDEIEIIDLDD